MARSLARALDPVLLAREASIEPDEWQAGVLRSAASQILLLCSRQSGKSTVTALLAVHRALSRAPGLVLLLAPALRQSQELFRKVKAILGSLANVPRILQESALSLEFTTGSRIVCLPGKEATIRGFSAVDLLVVDEASRVPDDLYAALRPMLAISGGRIVLLSTPFGQRGFFHHEATRGGSTWERVKVTAHDCLRIDAKWLEEERQAIGDWIFRQEYLCEFVSTDDTVFSHDLIMAALDPSIQPFF